MSDMKCPFCQQELEINDLDVQLLGCENQNCKHSIHYDTVGSKELWQELIRTRKALEIAVGQLKKTHDYIEDFRYQETNYFLVDSKDVSIILDETNEALEQITTITKGE